MPFDLLCNATC